MVTYKEWSPTEFDGKGQFMPERAEWLVLGVMRTRDSGPLDRVNFTAALEHLGGESGTVEVHRFGHWGPGWIEVILVDPSDVNAVAAAEEVEASLMDYPVLDEEALSAAEHEEFERVWEDWGREDFRKMLERRADAIELPRGKTKRGYREEDLRDGVELLQDHQLDAMWEEASKRANWSYQCDGDSMLLNIHGVVDKVADSAIVGMADAALFDRDVAADIARLCRAAGIPSDVEKAAVEKRITMLSAIRSLAMKMEGC